MNMNTFSTLAMPVIAAILLVLAVKIVSFVMEQPDKPFTRRFTRRVESIALVMAALIVIAAVFYQVTQTGAARLDPTPSVPSGSLICVPGAITIDGSTALAPLVRDVALDYEAQCPHASITVNQSSSSTGLSNVEIGKIDIANSDISALQTQGDLIDHRVAVVVFTIVISNDLSINNLTSDQLYGIFNGTITNWSSVGGPDLPITIFARVPSSGTRTTFNSYILCQQDMKDPPGAHIAETGGQVASGIQHAKGAIGYVDLGTAVASHLNRISIDGMAATAELVRLNSYKFWNIEHMYTKGLPAANSLTSAFIQYMTNTPQEEQLAAAHSYVNFNLMANSGLANHQVCRR